MKIPTIRPVCHNDYRLSFSIFSRAHFLFAKLNNSFMAFTWYNICPCQKFRPLCDNEYWQIEQFNFRVLSSNIFGIWVTISQQLKFSPLCSLLMAVKSSDHCVIMITGISNSSRLSFSIISRAHFLLAEKNSLMAFVSGRNTL